MQALFERMYDGADVDPDSVLEGFYKPLRHLLNYGGGARFLFLLGADQREVQRHIDALDRGERLMFTARTSPYVTAGVLFEFLRMLPDSLVPSAQFEQAVALGHADVRGMKQLVGGLPMINRVLLSRLCAMLSVVADVVPGYEDDRALLQLCQLFQPLILRPASRKKAKKADRERSVRLVWIFITSGDVFDDATTAPAMAWEQDDDASSRVAAVGHSVMPPPKPRK